jgi:hypothetical protein
MTDRTWTLLPALPHAHLAVLHSRSLLSTHDSGNHSSNFMYPRDNDLIGESLPGALRCRTAHCGLPDNLPFSGRVAGRDRVLYHGSQLVDNRTV